MRARDLIEMIGSPALIPLAAKYANKLGRIHLAEKLSEMLPRVLEMEREREKETEIEMVEQSSVSISQMSVIPSSQPSPKPTAVVVAPKLIKPGAGKRNPFKKSLGSNSANSSPNPIKYLTDSIVGLPTTDSYSVERAADDQEKLSSATATADKNVSGSAKTTPSSRKTFFEWFTEKKAEITAEMPEGSNPAELTSFAMKKYKQLHATGTTSEVATNSAKRKLDEKENEGGSGIAKLAKFRVET